MRRVITSEDNERLLFKGLITCTLAAINVVPAQFNVPAMIIAVIATFGMWIAEVAKEV